MNDYVKCPICHNKANRTFYSGERGVQEEYIHCNICNFDYEFAYGNYSETVGNKQFLWSYNIPVNKQHQQFKKISNAEFITRRNWKRFKKKTIRRKIICL